MAQFEIRSYSAAQRDTAHNLIDRAGVALLYAVIFATFAAFSLVGCMIWLLIW